MNKNDPRLTWAEYVLHPPQINGSRGEVKRRACLNKAIFYSL